MRAHETNQQPGHWPKRLRDMGDEAILLGGGGRAILLQLADPAVGHAVAEHSAFSTDPTKRLRHTLTFVYAIIWGTPQQSEFVTTMVNRAHKPVESGEGATLSYSAVDPQLQLWVAATLYDSAIVVYERIFGPLNDEDADAIYQDYAQIGVALQMPRELWPADRAAFRAYWNAKVETLVVDDVTRDVAQRLLHPSHAPLWLKAAMPLARLLTVGLLGAELREAFGLRFTHGQARRFERMLRLASRVYPLLPRAVRLWPKNHLLRGLPTPSARGAHPVH